MATGELKCYPICYPLPLLNKNNCAAIAFYLKIHSLKCGAFATLSNGGNYLPAVGDSIVGVPTKKNPARQGFSLWSWGELNPRPEMRKLALSTSLG